MYPSDYGYATSGGSTTDRATCLKKELFRWNSSNVSDCKNNDWLFNGDYQFTISPSANTYGADFVINVAPSGSIANDGTGSTLLVQPVVYLASNMKISGGVGTSE